MQLVGANSASPVSGAGELPGKSNYFIGADPQKWRTNIPTYTKVRYESIYPGIDLVYYGNGRQLEYDFVVNPGADPETIGLNFSGADGLDIDSQGALVLHMTGGDIRQPKPLVYQESDGVRHEIAGSYAIEDSNRVRFQIAAYDRSRQLIIDPTLTYSTYLGSGGAIAPGLAIDSGGNVYVAGGVIAGLQTTSGVVQPSFAGGDATFASDFGPLDSFVTKINAAGNAVVYSTYLGGSGDDVVSGAIAVDSSGNAYVAGGTDSANFPITAGAFHTTLATGGQCSEHGVTRPCQDIFVTKLNAAGSALVYSTYLGGKNDDEANDITLDSSGNVYVAGATSSADFPTTS